MLFKNMEIQMILIKNEIKRNKIWRHIFNDHSRNCFKDDGKDRGRNGKSVISKLAWRKTIDGFGNEEVKCLSQKGAVLYEGLEETLKILSYRGYVCSLYLYVKIELDKEWLYEKIYGFA